MRGKVYRIIHKESDIQYVGSTIQKKLGQRWQNHKEAYKQWQNDKTKSCSIFEYFDQYGIENFTCILIKEYEVVDKKHLYALEQLWINKLCCVNKQCAFQPIKKERDKQYRKENKQKLSEKMKQYRKANQQQIKEKNKQYRKENKQQISEKMKQYYRANQQKLSEYKKQYYYANQQQLLEKIECSICKSVIRKDGLKRHQRTAKCQQYQ